jgi:hypothetical protein
MKPGRSPVAGALLGKDQDKTGGVVGLLGEQQ